MDFCVIPFSEKQCEVYLKTNLIRCYVDPLNTYRQSTCSRYQEYFILFILSNFALFYPPYIDILFDVMKRDRIDCGLQIDVADVTLELDLYPFINRIQLDEMYIYILATPGTNGINLIINSPLKNYLPVDKWSEDVFSLAFNGSSKTNETIKNDMLCYNFLLSSPNNERQIVEKYLTCPSDTCLTHHNQTRVCLGSTPCSRMGSSSLLCRIDRLHFNDQFNSNKSFLYTDLIITTSDTHPQALHTFSAHLLNSCMTRRLTMVIIYGRLEIPSLNSTSFHCPDGLSMKVEFWHGNCSTFEILHTNDLERMYETNLITLGNFYTGQTDKLKIACAVHQSTENSSDWLKIPISFWIILSIISIITLGISLSILWYYKRSFRQYFIRLWRTLTMDRKSNTNIDLDNSSNSGLSGTLYNIKG